MDGKGFYAHFLQSLRHFLYIDAFCIPAQPSFYRNWQFGRIYHRFGEFYHQINIFQNSCSSAFADYLFHRTAEIDIHQIWLYRFHYLGRHRHRFLIAPKNLNPHRSFVIKDIQLFFALYRITNKPLGGDKF